MTRPTSKKAARRSGPALLKARAAISLLALNWIYLLAHHDRF